MSNGITKDNILSTLPYALAQNETYSALAAAIATVLANHFTEEDAVRIYPRIAELSESLLDILAKDFKVDWWSGDYSLAEKRSTMADAWKVHAKLGTKQAVLDAINAVYDGAQVLEWWEYDADPYHFKVYINNEYQGVDPEKYAKVISKVQYYKNLRSVFDGVEFVEMGASATGYMMTSVCSEILVEGATAQ